MKSENSTTLTSPSLSRRDFVRNCVLSASALAALPIVGCCTGGKTSSGPSSRTVSLSKNWLFGGKLNPEALAPGFDDSSFEKITLPHCATHLSWQNWDWKDWQDVWCYRRHFTLPENFKSQRVFLDFDGVMVGTEPTINGSTLPKHLGGYLPFHYEITNYVKDGGNVLAVAVDSRWSNVPPQGSPKGPAQVDYLEPGGIHRPVKLRAVPQIFISDVFAKPVDVLKPTRRVDVLCSLDAAAMSEKPLTLEVALKHDGRTIARAEQVVNLTKPGVTEVNLTLANFGDIKLWDVDSPHLYEVITTLSVAGTKVHDYHNRIGFREARFEVDGFYLNGRRLQIFGLDRHEVYPYVGYAMPSRVKRHDAEILKNDFNCNFVRCSHYPQSPAFLDACDELGLLVWQEVPGWQYIGDDTWKELLLRDTHDMIVRDRNRPSVVIWGTRVNESPNDVPLYEKTKAIAKALDDSRPSSGSMTTLSKKNWDEDVFAYDDYHATPEHTVDIHDAVPGVPYMLAEAVGQYNYATGKGFTSYYRRTNNAATQQFQAVRHAQAHSNAASKPRISGVVAWCGFEYGSIVNGYHAVKYPGVADIFRVPKLGATFYLAQCDPKSRVVIEPNFYWDFGADTPRGPGNGASIFSNCDRLEVFINGKAHATLKPDATNYPHLKAPPFFVDLDLDGAGHPELRIDGYLGDRLALSRSFSSDPAHDQLVIAADHGELIADGSDATRLVFKVADKFGANRAFAKGTVTFEVTGPGAILGDNPFDLAESGGVGAVWIKTISDRPGKITVLARHSQFGTKSAEIAAQPDPRSGQM